MGPKVWVGGCTNPITPDPTPLFQAIDARDVALAFDLLSRSCCAELNRHNTAGKTLLLHAAQKDLPSVCDALLNHANFIEVATTCDDGQTALHAAARWGHVAVCQVL